MRIQDKAVLVFLVFATLSAGCTHTQLRYNHTSQAKSLTGIYESQVLDNLAMFKKNPNALPFFAVPKAGSAQVSDNGAISASPLNGPAHTVLSLSSLSRNNVGSWTLEPISDPSKLRRMQCAYRRALGYAFDECNKCCQLQEDWENKERTGATVCCDPCKFSRVKIEECGKRFAHNPCERVGSYCGVHVRLCSDKCSQQAFTQLVLNILDYAVNEPAGPYSKPKMEVEHYHYKQEGGAYLLDGQGRYIIDTIDKFEADAHPIVEDDGDEVARESSDAQSYEEWESRLRKEGKRLVVPRGDSPSLEKRSSKNILLEGAIDQLQRDVLLPSIAR